MITQNDSVKYSDIKEFIQTVFLPLKDIQNIYLFFFFSAMLPEIVLCSVNADSEKVQLVIRKEDICDVFSKASARERLPTEQ